MIYQAIIKFPVSSSEAEKAQAISDGLQYAALLLIDECGWTLERVEEALDEARAAAEDEWWNLHPEGP